MNIKKYEATSIFVNPKIYLVTISKKELTYKYVCEFIFKTIEPLDSLIISSCGLGG